MFEAVLGVFRCVFSVFCVFLNILDVFMGICVCVIQIQISDSDLFTCSDFVIQSMEHSSCNYFRYKQTLTTYINQLSVT